MAKKGKSRQQAKGRASSAKRSSPAPAKAAPRAGSVAAKRAAGTNKAAQNQAAPRPGSVAARRAAGTNKAAQNQAGGNNPVRARDRTQEQKQAARQGRQDSYNAQDITQASDFDFSDRTKNKVGAGEIRHLRKEGHDRESIQQAAADSGLRIGKNAQKRFDRWDERRAAREKAKQVVENPVKQPVEETSNANVEQEPNTTPVPKPTITTPEVIIDKPITPKPTTTTTPTVPTTTSPNPSTSIDNEVEQSQDQEVNQDNDINSSVNGDNNNVNINQDNSVRQYGGINKSFVYNSTNGNNYMDTPVSAATMGGYFHDEDSPGRSASFVDRYQTMNRDYQKQFSNSNFAQQAISKGAQNAAVDIGALDQRVNDRAKLSRARSTSMAGDVFGDMFNYTPQEFQARKPEDEEDTDK